MQPSFGISSVISNVSLSTAPGPVFVTVTVYRTSLPGMAFGLLMSLTGSDKVSTFFAMTSSGWGMIVIVSATLSVSTG